MIDQPNGATWWTWRCELAATESRRQGIKRLNSSPSGIRNVLMGNQFSPAASTPGPTPEQVTVTSADQFCLPSFKTPNNGTGTPEVPLTLLLPLSAITIGGATLLIVRRREHV